MVILCICLVGLGCVADGIVTGDIVAGDGVEGDGVVGDRAEGPSAMLIETTRHRAVNLTIACWPSQIANVAPPLHILQGSLKLPLPCFF